MTPAMALGERMRENGGENEEILAIKERSWGRCGSWGSSLKIEVIN